MDTNVLCLIECPEFVSIRVNSWLARKRCGHWSHACHAIASCDGGSLVYVVKELLDRINRIHRISAVNSKDFVHSVSIIRLLWRQPPSPAFSMARRSLARRRLLPNFYFLLRVSPLD